MAQLTGYSQAFHDDTSAVDSTAKLPIGTRALDPDGNEYVYARGVASVAANDLVHLRPGDNAGVRAVADGVGRVGIAMAAIVADSYGWFQVYGQGTVTANAGVSSGIAAYLTAAAGSIGTAVVAGDLIDGMFTRSAVAGGSATVELNFPFTDDKDSG